MIVLDTSAAIAVLLDEDQYEQLVARIADEPELHAPHLLDVEFLHALRGMVRRGRLALARAETARADLAQLRLVRYPHEPFADRIWALRDRVSAYDATFIALAESLGAVLLTCDVRLAGAAHDARIETY